MHWLKCWSLGQEETRVIPVNLIPGLLSRSSKAARSPRCAWLSVDSELTSGSNPAPSNRASGTDYPFRAGRHGWGVWGEGQRKRMSPRALGWENEEMGSCTNPAMSVASASPSASRSLRPPHFLNRGGQSREDEQTSVWMLPVVMLDKLLKILKLQFLTGLQWLILCINLTGPQSARYLVKHSSGCF